jgi:hypothetical protein
MIGNRRNHGQPEDCPCHPTAPAVDLVLLRDALRTPGQLEAVGGVDALVNLVESVPSAGNGLYYAGIVKEMARKRRMIEIGGRMVDYSSSEVSRMLMKASWGMLTEATLLRRALPSFWRLRTFIFRVTSPP